MDRNPPAVGIVERNMRMWGRVTRAMVLGAIIVVMLVQPAAAFCPEQPFTPLVKQSDAVWWGTVIGANAAPEAISGTWELTVQLDDVLKGDGAPGDTVSVFTYSCGKYVSRSAANHAAASLLGDQRLFLISDRQGQHIAYSGIVRLGGDTRAPAYTQYAFALHVLGFPPPHGTPTEGGHVPGDEGLAVFGPLVAVGALTLIGVLIVVLFFRRQTR
jgi:hypothetical protein